MLRDVTLPFFIISLYKRLITLFVIPITIYVMEHLVYCNSRAA